MFYFAYGSNMHHAQMKRRCPQSRFIKRVCLKDYSLAYDGYADDWRGAVANLVATNGGEVWGGLYEISESDLAALDRYEEYPTSYARSVFLVRDDKNKIYTVLAYVRTGETVGEPSKEYRSTVLQGARDCGLPGRYVHATI